jgi:hypothetical protein
LEGGEKKKEKTPKLVQAKIRKGAWQDKRKGGWFVVKL